MQTIFFEDLGCINYPDAWALQESLMEEILTAKKEQKENHPPHHLLFCEHPHVYTLGKSGAAAHLLANDERLKEINASFYRTNRGGDITYHGPGQIVGYPILDLELFFTDLGRYMRNLEEVIIEALKLWGIHAGRLSGATGVWLDADSQKARKVCAMGVKCSRWVTIHGFALNVNTDLQYFNHIVPCGIADKQVTSMQHELGYEIDETLVKSQLKKAFEKVFEARIIDKEKSPANV